MCCPHFDSPARPSVFPAVRPAISAVIACIFHHDEGALWYRVNDGPRCFALDGFPPAFRRALRFARGCGSGAGKAIGSAL